MPIISTINHVMDEPKTGTPWHGRAWHDTARMSTPRLEDNGNESSSGCCDKSRNAHAFRDNESYIVPTAHGQT